MKHVVLDASLTINGPLTTNGLFRLQARVSTRGGGLRTRVIDARDGRPLTQWVRETPATTAVLVFNVLVHVVKLSLRRKK